MITNGIYFYFFFFCLFREFFKISFTKSTYDSKLSIVSNQTARFETTTTLHYYLTTTTFPPPHTYILLPGYYYPTTTWLLVHLLTSTYYYSLVPVAYLVPSRDYYILNTLLLHRLSLLAAWDSCTKYLFLHKICRLEYL